MDGIPGAGAAGSIISAECTCSHMPVPEPSRTYLRPHAFPHPPPGTRGRWAAAPRGCLALAAREGLHRGARVPKIPVCTACLCQPFPHPHGRVWRGLLAAVPAQGMLSAFGNGVCRRLGRDPALVVVPATRPSGSVRNVWGFQSSDPFAALALASPFLPGVFPDFLRST